MENTFKGPLIDLGLHHPPCRSYAANRAFHALGQTAQALLRAVQFTALAYNLRRAINRVGGNASKRCRPLG